MMFISEDCREQMREDARKHFRVRNPNALIDEPLTGMHWLIHALRWLAYYKLPDFIH